MVKIQRKIRELMIGRYGADDLFKAEGALYIALVILNLFLHTYILLLIETAIFVHAMFRCLSRNFAKRQAENYAYTKAFGKVKTFVKLRINMVKDIKTHVYRKCPSCGIYLRLPRKKGQHTACCPKCATSFETKI